MRDECEHGSLTRKCEICSEWKPRALEAEARMKELEEMTDNIPEGCTPADARVPREANHGLAAENDELRARIKGLEALNHLQRICTPPLQ